MSWVKKSNQNTHLQPFSQPNMNNDPYQRYLQKQKYSKNLVAYDSSSKFSKKWTKLKLKLNEAKYNAINGAMMGFMVGGLFGFAVGLYSAIQSRRFIVIPISVIISGCSFGFILGCGSLIRTHSPDINTIEKIQLQEINNWNNQSSKIEQIY